MAGPLPPTSRARCLFALVAAALALGAPARAQVVPPDPPPSFPPQVGGTWGPVLVWPHVPVSMANLPDGRVLTFSSNEPGRFPASQDDEYTHAAVWDPDTGELLNVPHPNHDMFCAALVMLESGEPLVMGGRNQADSPWTSYYDFHNDQWVQIEDMNRGRWYPTAVYLGTGEVFIAAGVGGGVNPEIWSPETGWKLLTGIDLSSTILQHGTRDGSGSWPLLQLAPDGTVFHHGATDTMNTLDPVGGPSNLGTLADLGPHGFGWFADEGVSVTYEPGRMLVAGGSMAVDDNTAVASAWTIDINGPGPQLAQTGDMNFPRQFQNEVLLPTGDVLVVGGNTHGEKFTDAYAVKNAEAWSPGTGTWTLMNAQDQARPYHSTAVLLTDGRVLSAGGGLDGDSCANPEGPGECGDDHYNAEVFSPPYLYLSDGSPAPRPTVVAGPRIARVGGTFTVQATPGLDGFSLVRMSSTTHTMNTDQRFLRPASVETGSGSYAISLPSERHVLVKGYWMLFALDGGVPSEAHVLQIVDDGVPRGTPIAGKRSGVGEPVLLQIDAADPDGQPLGFAASGLPDGLSIDPSTGVIDGTPTQAGVYNVVVSASDGADTGVVDFPWIVTTVRSEIGTLTVDQPDAGTWHAIDFAAAFQQPIVVIGPPSYGDPEPVTVRVRNVTPTGFEFQLREWLYQDGVHGPETVSYLVVEAGEYQIPGGGSLVAGRSVGLDWYNERAQALPAGAFVQPPIVLAQVVTDNHGETVVPRLENVTTGGFRVRIQGEEGQSNNLPLEDVHWVAVERGSLPALMEAAWTADTVTEAAHGVSYSPGFAAPPHFLAMTQTLDGSDPMALRHQAASGAGIEFFVEEEASNDGEIGHTTEVVGWLAVDASVSILGLQSLFNQAPTLATPPPPTTVRGEPVSLFVLAQDPDGDTLAFSAVGLAPGLSIHPDTGEITGSPSAAGTYPVTVTAADPSNAQGEVTFVWTVQEPLLLLPFPTPPQLVGATVDYTAQTNLGGGLLFSWDFGDGSVAGPSASPSVSHAFAAGGRYVVTLVVTDPVSGDSDQRQFVQNVTGPPTPLPPTSSSSITYEVSADRVWAINPDNDSVKVIDALTLTGVAEIPVCGNPRSVAVGGDGRVWVTCKDDDAIDVIDPAGLAVVAQLALPRGSRPHGIAFDPTGAFAYVGLETAGRVVKLDGLTGAELASQDLGLYVRHVAVSADGATLHVTRFVTPPLPGEATGVPALESGGNPLGGEVLWLDAASLSPLGTTILAASMLPDSEQSARGIPNYLGAPVISPQGTELRVPSKQDNVLRGQARDGQDLVHDKTVRAITSRVDLTTHTEELLARVDHDNASMASAALYSASGAYVFTALEGNRQVAVVDALDDFELGRVLAGRAPQGLARSPDGKTLFVDDFMDRTVSVFDLSDLIDYDDPALPLLAVVAKVQTEALAPDVLIGKQLFYDALDPRLGLESYMACAACHNAGGQDGRVWDFTQFGEGMRNTIGLEGRGQGHGRVHWTANFDEVQDFEGQIRGFTLGLGLMADADFAGTADPLGASKAGFSADLDALAAYVASLTEAGRSPGRQADGMLTADAAAGAIVFLDSGCRTCHGGAAFSDSADGLRHDVGTLKPTSGAAGGIDTPTLRGLWTTGPYLHDGSAATLADAVLAHSGVVLTAPELSQLVAYLEQIDDAELTAPNRSPVIAALEDRWGVSNAADSLQVTATDPDGDSLTYGATNLPPGLSIDATGLIQGIASGAGTFDVVVSVSDGTDESTTAFYWVIKQDGPPGCGLGFELVLLLPLLAVARRSGRRRA